MIYVYSQICLSQKDCQMDYKLSTDVFGETTGARYIDDVLDYRIWSVTIVLEGVVSPELLQAISSCRPTKTRLWRGGTVPIGEILLADPQTVRVAFNDTQGLSQRRATDSPARQEFLRNVTDLLVRLTACECGRSATLMPE